MIQLLKTPLRTTGWLFAAALIAAAQQGNTGRPGMINYTEGQVSINGNTIQSGAVRQTEVRPGDVLETGEGRAEMLLTPGVFLRLGHDSAAQMINPSLTDTKVQLQQGEAMIEVDQIADENHLAIVDNGVSTRLEKKGIYEFEANPARVAVYDGKAVVTEGDQFMEVKKGHELSLQTGTSAKAQKFDRDETDQLYAWSKLRSSYVAQANEASARAIIVDNPGWYAGTGWYWNPWFDSWAFVPGAGFINSPFGFGFYSPGYWYYNVAPIYTYGYGWNHRFPGRYAYHGRVPVGNPGGFHGRMNAGPRVGTGARVSPGARMPAMRGGGGHFSGGHVGGRR